MCGSIGEPDELLEKIRARRRAAGEPITGFDPDRSVLDDPVRDRDNPKYAELVSRRVSLDNGSRSGGDLGADGVSDEEVVGTVLGIQSDEHGVTATIRLAPGWTIERIEAGLRHVFWGGPDDYDTNGG